MTYRLPITEDTHTSDLINVCSRAVMHRHLGEEERLMQRALFSGLVAHAALEEIHLGNWSIAGLGNTVERACRTTLDKAKDEKRIVSEAVARDMTELLGKVSDLLAHYIERQGEYFAQCKLIGVELPVRWTMPVEGHAEIPFASHIDLLYRDPSGEIRLRDFKLNDESFTMAYLARNLQFALYHFCIADGLVMVDGDWIGFGELPWIEVVDLANFKPYMKATKVEDFETGETLQYVKGDVRPLANLIRCWRYSPSKESAMKMELATRVAAMRAGYWPMNPDKRGCQLCQSKRFCTNFIHEHEPQ